MLSIRFAALRGLRSSASLSAVAQCNTRSFTTALIASSGFSSPASLRMRLPSLAQRSIPISIRRTYATDDAGESPAPYAEDMPESFSRARPRGRMEFEKTPSNSLYTGNLNFEVNEETLRKVFEEVAPVKSVKLIYDGRGLSKGFGYVEFEDVPTATRVRDQMDQQSLEGRLMTVQYATQKRAQFRRTAGRTFSDKPLNPPSKTLFVGNMSFDMTDADLNELFREIKNVLDVRVAIDRRTGQPRGFAHADFIDVASAEAAAELLKDKEYYGRTLRIDYSAPTGARERSQAAPAVEATE